MPLHRNFQQSGVHRAACLALYRALLRQTSRLPPADQTSHTVHKHFCDRLRSTFRHNAKLQSKTVVVAAFRQGYQALDKLNNLVSRDNVAYDPIIQQAQSLKAKYFKRSSASRQEGGHSRTSPSQQDQSPGSACIPAKPSILTRPYPVVSGSRIVPHLISANGFPFLRYRRPQPPALSRVINDRIRAFEHRYDRTYQYQDQVQLGKLEDAWDQALKQYCNLDPGGIHGPSWSQAPSVALNEVYKTVRRHAKRTRTMALDMYHIVEKERALAEKERLGRRDEKHRKNKAKRLARCEVAQADEPAEERQAVITGLPSPNAASSDNMTDKQPKHETFKSRFDIPYSDLSALNTVDLHFPTNPAPDSQKSDIWLIYIHGGAFRDPSKTSRSILPTLPYLFSPSSPYHQPHIHGVASLNYRLSPHPTHPTNPSKPGDPARSSEWPDYINDVKAGIAWVLKHGDDGQENTKPDTGEDGIVQRRYILAGHSVGGTMAMLIAQSDPAQFSIPLPLAIIPLCGIYNFVSLRDAHPATDIYNIFTTAAFGPEELGGWERGDCTKGEICDEVKVVVMGHGKEDTLVEWGQAEEMAGVMDKVNSNGGNPARKGARRAVLVEVKGDHDALWEEGVQIAGCVDVAMKTLEELGGFGNSVT